MFWNVNVDQFKDLLQSGDSFVAIIVENSLFCFYFWVGLYRVFTNKCGMFEHS